MLKRAVLLCLLCTGVCLAQGKMAFTVSMPQPSNHTYHVTLRCEGLHGELQDFKMPQWSPGYYGIGDYARSVSNFHAVDLAGHQLEWEKVTKNTWRVVADNSPVVVLDYDVFGNTSFAANNYLGEDRGYLSPSGLFLNLAGHLQQPVTVKIHLPPNWKRISTGLEAVNSQRDTFEAPDFDVLYDSPILIGNQEQLQFDVKGVPHYIAIENVPAEVDRSQMTADLKSMVTAATQLMGEVPYKHYTFLMMGRGGGGIEHANSSSNQFNGTTLTTPEGYLRWLSFICHEYFHNFNVKRIRPLALGPFDYDQENLTNMLWVSEGLSVYYEDLVLVRAGLMTKDQYLAKMAAQIGTFENSSGRHYQSATESSWNTWNSSSGVGGDRNTTISYYNNGAMLGAMLDLKIRENSANRRSLDDVMRGMYKKYYVQKKRGFTDAEFEAECESVAGTKLEEVFSYAATSKEVNYVKYFGLAGLKLERKSEAAPGGSIGLDTRSEEIPANEMPSGRGGRGREAAAPALRLFVTDIAAGSPSARAELQPGDRIVDVDGTAATPVVLNTAINAKKPGEKITLHLVRADKEMTIEVEIAPNMKSTYQLSAVDGASRAQQEILNTWLRKAL
jgi:predicted metalloprotease with PDZ domain